MNLTEIAVLMDISEAYLGQVSLAPADPVAFDDAREYLEHREQELRELLAELQEQGATYLLRKGDTLFFESANPVDVEGVQYHDNVDQMAEALEFEEDEFTDVLGGDEAYAEEAMLGWEIEEADWNEFEDFNRGKSHSLEQGTFEYLKEIGLVSGTPEEPEITELGGSLLEL